MEVDRFLAISDDDRLRVTIVAEQEQIEVTTMGELAQGKRSFVPGLTEFHTTEGALCHSEDGDTFDVSIDSLWKSLPHSDIPPEQLVPYFRERMSQGEFIRFRRATASHSDG